jgi:hypothetical protein
MIALTIQDHLCFHMNFMIDFSISASNIIGIWMGIAVNIQIAVGSITILRILVFWSISMGHFSIFRCLVWFLSSLIYTFCSRDFSLLSLNLFIGILLFKAIINEINFLNYFSVCIAGIFILYLATLQKVLMLSKSILVEFSGPFRYNIRSNSNKVDLTSSFTIWILFIFFVLSYYSG